jgi:hypothetical protein
MWKIAKNVLVSLVLAILGYVFLVLWLSGCAARKPASPPANTSAIVGCVHFPDHGHCENGQPDLSGTLGPKPTWQCPKDYALFYQGREASVSEMQDHNADCYCVPKVPKP